MLRRFVAAPEMTKAGCQPSLRPCWGLPCWGLVKHWRVHRIDLCESAVIVPTPANLSSVRPPPIERRLKCIGDEWCPFGGLDLAKVTEHGVYIVWHGGTAPHTAYVGQGDVADRIADHRNDPTITRHAQKGALYVTWASVPVAQRDGIERYLADKHSPLEGDWHPEVAPLAVNSPWK